MRKICAFTLAEVLITLMILGIIAMVTIPALINKWQEKALVSQLKSTYSILARAHIQAVAENGPADTWDIGPANSSAGATKLYNYYKPYLRISKECGTGTGCFASHYSALFNNTAIYQLDDNYTWVGGKAVLANGAAIFFWSKGKCSPVITNEFIYCGTISIDINGKDGPNKAGVDYFEFLIGSNQLFPPPAAYYKSSSTSDGWICKYQNTSSKNGSVCTGYVLQHGNMDYLRRDVSGDD